MYVQAQFKYLVCTINQSPPNNRVLAQRDRSAGFLSAFLRTPCGTCIHMLFSSRALRWGTACSLSALWNRKQQPQTLVRILLTVRRNNRFPHTSSDDTSIFLERCQGLWIVVLRCDLAHHVAGQDLYGCAHPAQPLTKAGEKIYYMIYSTTVAQLLQMVICPRCEHYVRTSYYYYACHPTVSINSVVLLIINDKQKVKNSPEQKRGSILRQIKTYYYLV